MISIAIKDPFLERYYRNARKNIQCFPRCKDHGDYVNSFLNDLRHKDKTVCRLPVRFLVQQPPGQILQFFAVIRRQTDVEPLTYAGMVETGIQCTTVSPRDGNNCILMQAFPSIWKLGCEFQTKRRVKGVPAERFVFEIGAFCNGSLLSSTRSTSFEIVSTRSLSKVKGSAKSSPVSSIFGSPNSVDSVPLSDSLMTIVPLEFQEALKNCLNSIASESTVARFAETPDCNQPGMYLAFVKSLFARYCVRMGMNEQLLADLMRQVPFEQLIATHNPGQPLHRSGGINSVTLPRMPSPQYLSEASGGALSPDSSASSSMTRYPSPSHQQPVVVQQVQQSQVPQSMRMVPQHTFQQQFQNNEMQINQGSEESFMMGGTQDSQFRPKLDSLGLGAMDDSIQVKRDDSLTDMLEAVTNSNDNNNNSNILFDDNQSSSSLGFHSMDIDNNTTKMGTKSIIMSENGTSANIDDDSTNIISVNRDNSLTFIERGDSSLSITNIRRDDSLTNMMNESDERINLNRDNSLSNMLNDDHTGDLEMDLSTTTTIPLSASLEFNSSRSTSMSSSMNIPITSSSITMASTTASGSLMIDTSASYAPSATTSSTTATIGFGMTANTELNANHIGQQQQRQQQQQQQQQQYPSKRIIKQENRIDGVIPLNANSDFTMNTQIPPSLDPTSKDFSLPPSIKLLLDQQAMLYDQIQSLMSMQKQQYSMLQQLLLQNPEFVQSVKSTIAGQPTLTRAFQMINASSSVSPMRKVQNRIATEMPMVDEMIQAPTRKRKRINESHLYSAVGSESDEDNDENGDNEKKPLLKSFGESRKLKRSLSHCNMQELVRDKRADVVQRLLVSMSKRAAQLQELVKQSENVSSSLANSSSTTASNIGINSNSNLNNGGGGETVIEESTYMKDNGQRSMVVIDERVKPKKKSIWDGLKEAFGFEDGKGDSDSENDDSRTRGGFVRYNPHSTRAINESEQFPRLPLGFGNNNIINNAMNNNSNNNHNEQIAPTPTHQTNNPLQQRLAPVVLPPLRTNSTASNPLGAHSSLSTPIETSANSISSVPNPLSTVPPPPVDSTHVNGNTTPVSVSLATAPHTPASVASATPQPGTNQFSQRHARLTKVLTLADVSKRVFELNNLRTISIPKLLFSTIFEVIFSVIGIFFIAGIGILHIIRILYFLFFILLFHFLDKKVVVRNAMGISRFIAKSVFFFSWLSSNPHRHRVTWNARTNPSKLALEVMKPYMKFDEQALIMTSSSTIALKLGQSFLLSILAIPALFLTLIMLILGNTLLLWKLLFVMIGSRHGAFIMKQYIDSFRMNGIIPYLFCLRVGNNGFTRSESGTLGQGIVHQQGQEQYSGTHVVNLPGQYAPMAPSTTVSNAMESPMVPNPILTSGHPNADTSENIHDDGFVEDLI